MQIFDTFLIHPLINLLVGIYQLVTYIHLPGALGFSIILTTIIIKQVLYPLTVTQLKTSKKMQEIQPKIKELKEKYKNDPKRLQAEQMNLFKDQGINPAAGCFPFIVQIVLLIGFYSAIIKLISLKPQETISFINKTVYFDFLKLNHVWDTNFFGLPLVKTPSQLMESYGFLIILIPIITALLQLVQSKMMMLPANSKNNNITKKDDKGSGQPDFSQAIQSQMLYMMPLVIGVVSYQFALGLSLYWNTFTIFGIIQQYKIQGLGGLREWIKK